MEIDLTSRLDRLLTPFPPKAAQFIVTVYGDVVAPRGGELWMGDLIQVCADFSISESLVRTAVSRLVSKGQLDGVRDGRRSYYHLTEAAKTAYQAAAARIFARPRGEPDWALVVAGTEADASVLRQDGFAEVGPGLFLGPERIATGGRGLVLAGPLAPGDARSMAFLSTAFELEDLSRIYAGFCERCVAVFGDGLQGATLPGAQALAARLALTHEFRAIRLRDPDLPDQVLPNWWHGRRAKLLFADLYCKLSQEADRHIGSQYRNTGGVLSERTQAIEERLSNLALWQGNGGE